MKKVLIVALLLCPLLAFSQMMDPVKFKISLSKQEVKAGEVVEIIISFIPDPTWQFYAVGENPPQAAITFEESPNYKLEGKIIEKGIIKQKYDEFLELDTRYFEGSGEFRQKVKILKENPIINIDLDGQACQPGKCVPVRKTFTVNDIKVTADATQKISPDTSKVSKKTTSNPIIKEGVGTSKSIERLEKEKSKLITKNGKGEDETIVYLKGFVKKYGGKK